MSQSSGPFSSLYQGLFGGPNQNTAAAGVDTSGATNWLNQQGTANNINNAQNMQLQMAQGKGPSAATDLLKAQTGQTLANTNALAASGAGISGQGIARRNAMMSGAGQLQNLGAQAAAARSAEQMGAMNQYGQMAQNQRGQDIQSANLMGQLSADQAQIQSQQNIANMQAAQNNASSGSNLFSGLVGAAASAAPLLMMSDERSKEPVNEGRFNVRQPATFGDAQFQEPGKPEVAFTLREEPYGLFGLNRYTGEYGKVPLVPLTPEEHRQTFDRPHGAGGLNSPSRKATVMHDADWDAADKLPFTGEGLSDLQNYPVQGERDPRSGPHNDPSKFTTAGGLNDHDRWRVSQGMAPESRSAFPGYGATSDMKGDESIEDYMARNRGSSATGDQSAFYGSSDPEGVRAREDARMDAMVPTGAESGNPDDLWKQFQQANESSIPKWQPPDGVKDSKAQDDENTYAGRLNKFYSSPLGKAYGGFANAMGHITTGPSGEDQKITGELYHDADFTQRGYSDPPGRELEITGSINSDESKKAGASAPFFRDVDKGKFHHVNEQSGAEDSIWSDMDSKFPSSGSNYADADLGRFHGTTEDKGAPIQDPYRNLPQGLPLRVPWEQSPRRADFRQIVARDDRDMLDAVDRGYFRSPKDTPAGVAIAKEYPGLNDGDIVSDENAKAAAEQSGYERAVRELTVPHNQFITGLAKQWPEHVAGPGGDWVRTEHGYMPASRLPQGPPDPSPHAANSSVVEMKPAHAQPAPPAAPPPPPPPPPAPQAKADPSTAYGNDTPDMGTIVSDAYRKEDPSHFGDELGHPRRAVSEVGPEQAHDAAVTAVTHPGEKTYADGEVVAGPAGVQPAHNNNEGALKPHVGNLPDQDAVQGQTPNNDQHGAGHFQTNQHPNSGHVIPGPISGGFGPPHEAGEDARKPRDWELNGDGSAVYGSDPGVSGIISDENKKISMADKKLGESVKRLGKKDDEANQGKSTSNTGDAGGKEQAEAKRGDGEGSREKHNSQHVPSKKDESSFGASPKKTERTDPYGAKSVQHDGSAWYEEYFKKQDAGPPESDGQSWGHPGMRDDIHAADLDMGSMHGMDMTRGMGPMSSHAAAFEAGMRAGLSAASPQAQMQRQIPSAPPHDYRAAPPPPPGRDPMADYRGETMSTPDNNPPRRMGLAAASGDRAGSAGLRYLMKKRGY